MQDLHYLALQATMMKEKVKPQHLTLKPSSCDLIAGSEVTHAAHRSRDQVAG